ncbi:thiopeptide-type bacteriocin biosynthesis protein [Embleya sp. AB8]|uniref:thiopeptide-type bacteriocin biosynthesis protein n=1 Tax=Embleya sp. AB8 TaxID=3156304 RepID=UPI003C707E56
MTVTPAVPHAGTWRGLHCFAHWRPEHTDRFLTTTLTPMVEGLRSAGRIEDWFFIRYAEHGPHLRIRIRGADPATTGDLRERLAEAVRGAPYPVDDGVEERYRSAEGGARTLRGHGEVCEVAYAPEPERYGGVAALPVAEEVFGYSSRIAAAAVACTPLPAQRLVAATDFVLATALALDLDELDTARWLRRAVIGWRGYHDGARPGAITVRDAALDAVANQAAAVLRRRDEIAASGGSGTRLRDRWGACVRAARARLETNKANEPTGADAADAAVGRGPWLGVWSAQLHMLLNRMGVLPDEERSLCWFIASSLLAPEGGTDFFADHPGAADRRYLEAGNSAPSRMRGQQPRSAPPGGKRSNPFGAAPVALPAGELPGVSLGAALARRTSARGDLGGGTSAADLGTALWSAYAGTAAPEVPDGPGAPGRSPRPYPSAGAKYVARLRLVVREVAGLAPGVYELEPATRSLLPVGPAPSIDELAAASLWFARDEVADPYVDVSTLPALVGLYVELGVLRARYGLRALRFAFLEAGHLAQNLALTAAAAGLSMGMVGGFYDDVAHEVFVLDGIDDVLAYLLPVGRVRSG